MASVSRLADPQAKAQAQVRSRLRRLKRMRAADLKSVRQLPKNKSSEGWRCRTTFCVGP
ncbi:MAG: hypothetical protein RLZZ524_2775 [Pseudomonadota bacterium]